MFQKSTLLAFAVAAGFSFAVAQSTTFNFTGSQQIYVVPGGCVTAVTVEAYGAQGGGNAVAAGGMGGHTTATIPVTPGETLYVYVGGTGDVTGTPGYNGGGSGIGGSAGNPGSGGGGASDVRKGGTALTDRWVVAGGGGGGTENGGVSTGGAGGGLIGADGGLGPNPWGCTPLTPGTGGTQSAGGLGGTSTSCAWNGFDGSFGQGGNSHNNYRCAGGGGGWYGGGGAHNGHSGGGGSSYAHPSATYVTHMQGMRVGNGMVVITPTNTFTVNLGPDTAGCAGFVLDAGHANGNHNWSTGDTTQMITAASSGSYIVTVDSGGCSATDTVNITIMAGPSVNLGPDTTVCSGLVLDAGNPGNTYGWSTGATTQTIAVGPGTYLVTVTNAIGCEDFDTITVTTIPPPSVNLGGSATGCDSVTLDAGNPGESWLWSTGDSTQTITVYASGTYSVTVTNGCFATGADTATVVVGSTSAASFTGLASDYCDIDPDVTLTGVPSGGQFSGAGITGNVFSPGAAGAGQFVILYVYTDSAGCISSAMDTTNVSICPAIGNPFPAALQLYPNPNGGRFSLSGLIEPATVEVYSLVGQRVFSGSATESRYTIDLGEVSKGMYIVRVRLGGEWYAQRVMVN